MTQKQLNKLQDRNYEIEDIFRVSLDRKELDLFYEYCGNELLLEAESNQ